MPKRKLVDFVDEYAELDEEIQTLLSEEKMDQDSRLFGYLQRKRQLIATQGEILEEWHLQTSLARKAPRWDIQRLSTVANYKRDIRLLELNEEHQELERIIVKERNRIVNSLTKSEISSFVKEL